MLKDQDDRDLFSEEHKLFREQVKRFVETEVLPYHNEWEEKGVVTKGIWQKAGAAGLLCPTVLETYGGPGADFLFSAIVIEELARVGASGPGFNIHSEMAAPYISEFGNEEQKHQWLPRFVTGEAILGIAMSEPDAGSDLRRISTTAKKDGNEYTINGQKVFISNGQIGDVFIVAAKTDKDNSANSMSLFLVESDRNGFSRGKNLKKIGAKAQDTSELFFDNVRIPEQNLIGTSEGNGFKQLMHGLARERLAIAVGCVAKAEGALSNTLEYIIEREIFGKKLHNFQNTQFKIAEVRSDILVGRSLVDQLLAQYMRGVLNIEKAASAKLWTSEMLGRTVDKCLQIFGGWGYMWEYPIAKAYAEARVERIAGGSSEVMKTIIIKSLFKDLGIKAEFN
ncbi:MAG: acyl-CoA dehydrogenase family protein [Pseudomonadota bacterium]|nr:acyl-CoA dehydrogenase family protein [Pseudomonadota bacterium]